MTCLVCMDTAIWFNGPDGSVLCPEVDCTGRSKFYIRCDGRGIITRMKKLTEIASSTVVSGIGDGSTVEYEFTLQSAGDVLRMLIKSAAFADNRMDNRVSLVIRTQADMIRQGLHLPEVPFPDFMGDVNKFHQKFGQEYVGKPRMLPHDLHDFRTKFHVEETSEYRDEHPHLSHAVEHNIDEDIVEGLHNQLDALCDSLWVLLGTADVQFGATIFNEAWRRVYEKNMAKVRADEDENAAETGREKKFDIRKPEGWTPPDHRDLVRDHAHKLYRA